MMDLKRLDKLPRDFYSRDVLSVARQILGKIFVRVHEDRLLAGRIVEVEAYDGAMDMAAHSYNGRTKRNEVMFWEGGFLYVYFTYGMHFCANVVTGKKDEGSAVLLRGIEPLIGIDSMMSNRLKAGRGDKQKHYKGLTNGPAKICEALSISRKDNGIDLTGNQIYILDAPSPESFRIKTSSRIGIKKSMDLPWRFYVEENSYVSSK